MSQLPETMKALVKAKPQEGLWMAEVPLPEMGKNDVLIRIRRRGFPALFSGIAGPAEPGPKWAMFLAFFGVGCDNEPDG